MKAWLSSRVGNLDRTADRRTWGAIRSYTFNNMKCHSWYLHWIKQGDWSEFVIHAEIIFFFTFYHFLCLRMTNLETTYNSYTYYFFYIKCFIYTCILHNTLGKTLVTKYVLESEKIAHAVVHCVELYNIRWLDFSNGGIVDDERIHPDFNHMN